MDEVIKTTLLTTDNSSLEEAFSAFCQVYMPARNFTMQTRRGYRYDLAEWLATLQVAQVKVISPLPFNAILQPLMSEA